ncbi:MAG TPA: hypothetical protein VK456_10445 [Xanthobacteraceae bacterium]|nr:hypothetical protein [Xanthobacteraceae bacterium]
MKKLAFLTSAAVALVCAAALVATPADAKRHHKKPAAAPAGQVAYGGGAGGHVHGGPIKSGNMCWKEDMYAGHTGSQFGYMAPCAK